MGMGLNCQSKPAGRCMCLYYVNIEKMKLLSLLAGVDELQLSCILPQTEQNSLITDTDDMGSCDRLTSIRN